MQDDQDAKPTPEAESDERAHEHRDAEAQAEVEAVEGESSTQPSWVRASGVSGEHVLGGERAPRLHWMLMILGPLGLAIAIASSLWSMSQHVEHSVNVQVETRWVAGELLAIRTQIIGADLRALPGEPEVSLRFLDVHGDAHELGELEVIGPGLAQGVVRVPALDPGAGELLLHYEIGDHSPIEPFDERVPVEVVAERGADGGRQVVSENMLQWADDTDEQPEGVRIDLRPGGRLLAGFSNRLFVRVTDPAGRPWRPVTGPATIQVLLVSGEFGDAIGDIDQPPVLYEGPVDALGLASLSGVLSSDVVRFEVRLAPERTQAQDPAQPAGEPSPLDHPAPGQLPSSQPEQTPYLGGPKRRLRFVSHAGTVRINASTDFAHPGDTIKLTIEALSARKPAFVDIHGPGGAWLDTITPPLRVPQEREWTIPEHFVGAALEADPFIQFEAYQSTLRPEDSSAIARVQLAAPNASREDSLLPLIERQRAQLSLPRVDRQFEIGRERAYLSHVETQHRAEALDEAGIDRARAFLIGSLEAVVHGPPQSLNTRGREDQAMATFKRNWTIGIRWFLLGGGGLFILVMSTMVWRNQRKLETQTSDALGLVAGSLGDEAFDDEAFADQSLAIIHSRRQILARGVLTTGLMVTALLLTLAMLESLVWQY